MIDVVSDLDGVIYRGDQPVEGSSEALTRLESSGARISFVTNNSTRTPSQVADKIRDITGVGILPDQVLTSSQAAAALLGPSDGPALIVGEEGIGVALDEADVAITHDPSQARSVVVGMDREVTYNLIADAISAVRAGARFLATNTDPTFPIATGLLPGAGVLVAAIATGSGVDPEVAGKPHPPMKSLIKARGISRAWVIGDRVDTDIALALDEPDWRSILVLTGVTTPEHDASTADHVTTDFSEAVDLLLAAEKAP